MAVLAKHFAGVCDRQRMLRVFGLRGMGLGEIGLDVFSLLFTLNGSQVSLLGCGMNLPLC